MGDVVEVTVAPNVGFAEVVVAELKAAGITAYSKGNLDRSYYAGVGAVSVFVDAADAEAARAIIDDPSRALDVDPDEPHYETMLNRGRAGRVLALVVVVPVLLAIVIAAVSSL
jgi:hypothetical protein